jgi:hypothetical protein
MTSGKKNPAEDPITIRGLLVPADWDDRGNITEMAVSTHFEEEYFIEQNARGEALLPFLRQKVKVIGCVKIDDRGRRIAIVDKYEILEE